MAASPEPNPNPRLNSIPEEPSHHHEDETQHLADLAPLVHANMYESIFSEALDKTLYPFNEALYRQWEKEFEQNTLDNKPLPPLPRIYSPIAQKNQEAAQMGQPKPGGSGAVPQTQERQSGQSGLVLPVRSPESMRNSGMEMHADNAIMKREEGSKEPRDDEFKSVWSSATTDENKEAKQCCCCVM